MNQLGLKSMNHRDIMLMAAMFNERQPKFDFLRIPEEIQDAVIDGLDTATMTYTEASQFLKDSGYSLSHESIRRYYMTLKNERRKHDMSYVARATMAQYANYDFQGAMETLLALSITAVLHTLSDGKLNLGNQLSRVMEQILKLYETLEGMDKRSIKKARAKGNHTTGMLPKEAREKIRRIYGMVRDNIDGDQKDAATQ